MESFKRKVAFRQFQKKLAEYGCELVDLYRVSYNLEQKEFNYYGYRTKVSNYLEK